LLIEAIFFSPLPCANKIPPPALGEATLLIASVMLSQQRGRVFSYWFATTEDLHCPSAQSQRILLFSKGARQLA
jgi:hypothetical protein